MEDGNENSALRVRINYGSGVVVLPRSAAEKLPSATKKETAVLLAILTHPDALVSELPALCGVKPEEFAAAAAFWRGAGILDFDGESEEVPARPASAEKTVPPAGQTAPEPPKKKVPARASTDLPKYTMEETARMVEGNKDLAKMLDDCGRILGKMLSSGESSNLLALVGQLDLDPEFILLVCAHCKEVGKSSVRYVMTTATEYFDEGISTVETLEEHLKKIEKTRSVEGKLREKLGIGARAFSSREKKFFETWTSGFGYDFDVLEIAFDIAADKGAEKPMPYMNGVIERWHADGLTTAAQIRESIERQAAEAAAQKETRTEPGKSFDSGDFFAAALQRSYQNHTAVPEVPAGNGKKTK